MHHSPLSAHACRGQAALALLLTLCGAALLLLPRPSAQGPAVAETRTRAALAEAREALLGYAAAYPDRVNAAFGPGYLPCPARDGRGVASPACAQATGSTRGRLPWHTLRTNDLRDASGAGLWYALSESHRYNPKTEPLNAATAVALEVDGVPAVAVVIAPGAALAGQARNRVDDPRSFLEGGNADDDVARYASDAGNDRLAVITARDLRRVIAARALAELARGLRRWAARHGDRYPWLVPLATPAGTPQVGLRRGWLPVHHFDGATPQPFVSAASPRWALHGVRIGGDTASPLLSEECLRRMPCRTPGGGLVALDGTAQCVWGDPAVTSAPRTQLRCAWTAAARIAGVAYDYALDIALDDADGDVPVRGPDAFGPRRRAVEAHGFAPRGGRPALRITITARAASGVPATVVIEGTAATTGLFAIDDLRYDVDVDAGELPAWLVRNGWHRHIAFAYAPCAAGGACLALERRDAQGGMHSAGAARAVLIAAGAPANDAVEPSAWFGEANRAALATGLTPFRTAPPRPGADDVVHVVEWAR